MVTIESTVKVNYNLISKMQWRADIHDVTKKPQVTFAKHNN